MQFSQALTLEMVRVVDQKVLEECPQRALMMAKHKTLLMMQIRCKMFLLIEMKKNVHETAVAK